MERKLLIYNSSVASPSMDLLGLGHMSILDPITETKGMKFVDQPDLSYVLTLGF